MKKVAVRLLFSLIWIKEKTGHQGSILLTQQGV